MALLRQGCISYEGSKVYQGDFQSPYTNEDYPAGTIINGYVLPPEPDHTENDKILLGIDVNHNGMRDDVERYIIIEESENPHLPKTWTSVWLQDERAMQHFWKTKDIRLILRRRGCSRWLHNYLRHHDIQSWSSLSSEGYLHLVFNTKKRDEGTFDSAMFGSESYDGSLMYCDDNLTAFGELP
jgi:hypothetical protein